MLTLPRPAVEPLPAGGGRSRDANRTGRPGVGVTRADPPVTGRRRCVRCLPGRVRERVAGAALPAVVHQNLRMIAAQHAVSGRPRAAAERPFCRAVGPASGSDRRATRLLRSGALPGPDRSARRLPEMRSCVATGCCRRGRVRRHCFPLLRSQARQGGGEEPALLLEDALAQQGEGVQQCVRPARGGRDLVGGLFRDGLGARGLPVTVRTPPVRSTTVSCSWIGSAIPAG